MVSAIIPTLNSQEFLPRLFESLIVGVMSGVLKEVIIADGGSKDDTLFISDAAGAKIVEAPESRGARLAMGAKAARGDWLMFLHPEIALEPRWDEEAISFMEKTTLERPRAAAFRLGVDDFGQTAKRIEFAAALHFWLLGRAYGEQGLLIPTRFYRKLGGHRPLDAGEDVDLARRIGRSRLVMLRSRALISASRMKKQGTAGTFGLAGFGLVRAPKAA